MQYLLRGLVLAIVLASPPLFFSRLYKYDWYRITLLDWFGQLGQQPNADYKTKILELGCGPGNLSAELSDRGYFVVGVDRSVRMIKHAVKLNSNAVFVEADALHLPMEANEFDVVILASLLNLVPERMKLLQEVKRVLKPEGVVSVLFPTPEFDGEKAQKISNRRKLGHFSTAALSIWAVFGRKLNPEDISHEFSEAGFVNISTEYYLDNGLASITAMNGENLS